MQNRGVFVSRFIILTRIFIPENSILPSDPGLPGRARSLFLVADQRAAIRTGVTTSIKISNSGRPSFSNPDSFESAAGFQIFPSDNAPRQPGLFTRFLLARNICPVFLVPGRAIPEGRVVMTLADTRYNRSRYFNPRRYAFTVPLSNALFEDAIFPEIDISSLNRSFDIRDKHFADTFALQPPNYN